MRVPFVDLKAQYFSIKNDIDNAMSQILENTAFIGGKPVSDFENAFAEIEKSMVSPPLDEMDVTISASIIDENNIEGSSNGIEQPNTLA